MVPVERLISGHRPNSITPKLLCSMFLKFCNSKIMKNKKSLFVNCKKMLMRVVCHQGSRHAAKCRSAKTIKKALLVKDNSPSCRFLPRV